MKVALCRYLLMLISAAGLSAAPARGQVNAPHVVTPADIPRLEEVGASPAFSPDGRWLAYVIKRPALEAFHMEYFLDGYDRADIWLVPTTGGVPRNLTEGQRDGSGFWFPLWSPDSQRLAFLSTRGGDVRLWLWEMVSGNLRQLTESGVDLESPSNRPFHWISSQELVCPVLPKGERNPWMSIETESPEIAIREWPRAWKGKEATASILDSGIPSASEGRPQGKLVLINLKEGLRDILTGISFRAVQVSTNGREISFETVSGFSPPKSGTPVPATLSMGPNAVSIGIVDSKGTPINLSFGGDKDVLRRARPGSLRWSLDGSELAVVEDTFPGDSEASPRFLRCRIDSRTCLAATTTQLELVPESAQSSERNSPFVWSSEGDLLINGRLRNRTSSQDERLDWWLTKDGGVALNLTGSLKSVPEILYPETKRNSVIGIADGHLIRLSLNNPSSTNIVVNTSASFDSVIWPSEGRSEPGSVSEIILGAGSPGDLNLYLVRLNNGTLEELPKPPLRDPSKYWLWDFAPRPGTALFLSVQPQGNGLWLWNSTSGNFLPVVETNPFLKDVLAAEKVKLSYRSLDGEELKAWLVLPIGYQKGKIYPLVAKVYAEEIADESFPVGLGDPSFELLAAHGYAVLLPSMPLGPWGRPADPLLELTSGVLPAIDKVIELGIADPDRVGVIGHSYGGYSVYGLITQTHRFKVAVSLAGISDLISLYGEFDARKRYTDYAHENLFRMWSAESGQWRMGGPPWADLGRYIRNSPVFYAERVQTPLMIVQGDLDYLGIQQGEEFFTALYRQGKRARFVRYWGEAHVIESPANLLDMWQRVFDWLDEFLKPIPPR